MKRVRSLSLAFAVCGLAAAAVNAQTTGGYPITGRYAAPALLPLPAMSGPWTHSHVTPASGVANAGSAVQAAPTYVMPSNNYVAARSATPSVVPSTRASSALSAPTFPHVAYNRATQEEVPAQASIGPPPVPTVAPTPAHGVEPVVSGVHGGVHDAPASVYEEAASGGWGGDCGVCMPSCCPSWYGYVGALYMTRDRSNRMWTTYETGNNANQLMYFPDADWGTGGEVTIGHTWCGTHGCDAGCTSGGDGCSDGHGCGGCGVMPFRKGLEFTYWGLTDMDGEDSRRSETNQLSTPIDLGFVDINTPGLPASVFFDNAREHRVRRENDFHNFEVNLVDFSTHSDRTLKFQWLAGGTLVPV